MTQPHGAASGRPMLPHAWRYALGGEAALACLQGPLAFMEAEIAAGRTIHPSPPRLLAALERTPPDRVRAVILGQDPYHGPGQAHGLSFSVPHGVPKPPSLRNILRELSDDLGMPEPSHGCLEAWADRGVLLLNSALSVRAGEAASHAGRGWEPFTDLVIRAVNDGPAPVVFLLWGAHAQRKAAFVDRSRHLVLASAHPSPLSARRGFFGSRPFSRANAFLGARGLGEIDWRLD